MADQLALFGQPQQELSSDDYYTPRWIFDALGVTFDLDVASPPGGPPFTPCRRYYTQADDGLASPWEGLVWMNPPYSKPAPWVEKWIRHANGFALLPTNGGKWCGDLWASKAVGVWLGRLAFVRNNSEKSGSPLNIVLWAIGERGHETLYNANLGAVR